MTAPYFFQIDLRDDPKTIAKLNDMKEKPIATEQGQKLAKEVGSQCRARGSLWPGHRVKGRFVYAFLTRLHHTNARK